MKARFVVAVFLFLVLTLSQRARADSCCVVYDYIATQHLTELVAPQNGHNGMEQWSWLFSPVNPPTGFPAASNFGLVENFIIVPGLFNGTPAQGFDALPAEATITPFGAFPGPIETLMNATSHEGPHEPCSAGDGQYPVSACDPNLVTLWKGDFHFFFNAASHQVENEAFWGMASAGSFPLGGPGPADQTPEPSSLLLVGTGILGLAVALRRRHGAWSRQSIRRPVS
jgi:hypothetical protein